MTPDEFRMPLPLRDHSDSLAAAILAADRVLLCTDFDGTLMPLQDDAASCRLNASVREMLVALHTPPQMHVAIVSGRRLADLRDRVGIAAITYAGNHGLEIEGRGMMFREPTAVACQAVLESLADDLDAFLSGIDGAHLERKGLSLTIHIRQVHADAVAAIRAVVVRAVEGTRTLGRLRIRGGKGVIEVRPNVDWDKGCAVEWLADRLGCAPGSRVFIGDDDTDEDAFAACRQDISIRVGSPDTPTAARYVAEPADVRHLLAVMAGRIADFTAHPVVPAARGRHPPADEGRGR